MNVRRISPADEAWIRENYETMTTEACAKELGVSQRTLFRWASSLGLPTKRSLKMQNKSNIANAFSSVRINKCCLICDKYDKVDACETASRIDGFSACKLVCWDFELRNELKRR